MKTGLVINQVAADDLVDICWQVWQERKDRYIVTALGIGFRAVVDQQVLLLFNLSLADKLKYEYE